MGQRTKGKIRRPYGWPWHDHWWKPKGVMSNLVRAAALIIAEMGRRLRAGTKERDDG